MNKVDYKQKAKLLFDLVPNEIKYDKDFIIKNLDDFGEFYDSFGDLNNDIEFILKAIRHNKNFIEFVPKDKITKEIVMEIFKYNPETSLLDFPDYTNDFDVISRMLLYSSDVQLYKNALYIDIDGFTGTQILSIIKASCLFSENLMPNDYNTLIEIIEQDHKCVNSVLPELSMCYDGVQSTVIDKFPQLVGDILKKYPKLLKTIPHEKLLCSEFFHAAFLIDPKYMNCINNRHYAKPSNDLHSDADIL